MPRETLTDRRLKSLKPAPEGADRYEIADAIVPGLRVRVNEAGKKTFVLLARFPASVSGKRKPNPDGRINPTRRTIGVYIADKAPPASKPDNGNKEEAPEIGSLEAARKKAREWLELIDKGIDPQIRLAETKAKEQARQENTFGAVFDDYVKKAIYAKDGKTLKLRNGANMENALRSEFVEDKIVRGKKRLGLKNRPIAGITKLDIVRVIDDKIDDGYETMAHSLFAWVRGVFNWAIDRGTYGIEASPCDRLKPKNLIGKKSSRDRVLSEEEIRALWMATEKVGVPYGNVYRVLLLTGLRKREVSGANRKELALKNSLWTIPKERMKGNLPHHLPLTKQLVEIFDSLPIHNAGPFLFSTTAGEKPINGFSKAKAILDREMLAALKDLAMQRGEDPEAVELKPFVIHDLRRTVRTHLSSLGVVSEVAEAVIAHKKKGVHAVYDQWQYIEEKRSALERWSEKVRSIVEPTTANVISLSQRR